MHAASVWIVHTEAAFLMPLIAGATCFGGSHCALLAFVRDDSPEQFARDAATLIDLLERGGYRG